MPAKRVSSSKQLIGFWLNLVFTVEQYLLGEFS